MIYVGQFPDDERIGTIRAHVLSQVVPHRAEGRISTSSRKRDMEVAREAADRMMAGWFGCAPPAARHAVDLADTNAFLRHAARLQGLDSDLALLFGRWRQLPYWLESIWVPGDRLVRPYLFDRVEEGPFFIGSAAGLAAELDEIAASSDSGFGEASGAEESERMRVRAVWQSFREAAALALELGLPMWTEL